MGNSILAKVYILHIVIDIEKGLAIEVTEDNNPYKE